MALSSLTEGMRTEGRLEIFDIVLYLATIGAAQADDPSQFATVYKCHVVQDFGFWSERDHSRLAVLDPSINPYDMTRLREAMLLLKENAEPLPPEWFDHPLIGDWVEHRECHVGGRRFVSRPEIRCS